MLMACGRPQAGRGSVSCGQRERGQKPWFLADIMGDKRM